MMKVTIKEIKEKYLASKSDEKKFVWTYYVRRPVSYYMTWPFLMLGFSANQVTLLWLFVGIMGSAFLTTGNYLFIVIGAILLELSGILDCVDGHIARFGRPTYSGKILDTWAGEIVLISSMFSLGIGLSKSTDTFLHRIMSLYSIGNEIFLYVGFFAALASLAAWAVRVHWRSTALKLQLDNVDPDSNLRTSNKVLILDNLFHYSGTYALLMIVFASLGASDAFILLIAMVYGGFLLKFMSTVVRKMRMLDNQDPM